jgi:hypothetical protein
MVQPNYSKETKNAIHGAPGALAVCQASAIPTSSPDACQAIQTQTEPRADWAIHPGGASNPIDRMSSMLVETIRTSTGAPVINFAAPAACQPARQSTIQKLCAEYERTLTAFKTAHDAYVQAENAEMDGRPRADSLIRPTRRNLADVGADVKDAGKRIPIMSREIRREIKCVRNNKTKLEQSGQTRTVIISDKVLPLTRAQRAQLARLEARLPIALAYEAQCAANAKRLRINELRRATNALSDKLPPLMQRLTDVPARSRTDLLAKARIFEIDPDMAESDKLGISIARDVRNLAAAAAI